MPCLLIQKSKLKILETSLLRLRFMNKLRVVGSIPGRLEEIRYRRTGRHAGLYKHVFRSKAVIFGLSNGGLLILPKGTKKLWIRDREL